MLNNNEIYFDIACPFMTGLPHLFEVFRISSKQKGRSRSELHKDRSDQGLHCMSSR